MRRTPARVHPERMHRVAAMAAALVGVAGEGVAIALAPSQSARLNELAVAADIVAYAAVGLVIAWHRPGHRIGTTALAMVCLWGPGQALVAHAASLLHLDLGNQRAALESVAGSTLRAVPWLVLVLWLPLIFPDGAAPRRHAVTPYRGPSRRHHHRRFRRREPVLPQGHRPALQLGGQPHRPASLHLVGRRRPRRPLPPAGPGLSRTGRRLPRAAVPPPAGR